MIRFDAATMDFVPIPPVKSLTTLPRKNEMKAMKIERRQWPRPSRSLLLFCICLLLFSFKTMSQTTNQTPRPRARDLGVVVGILPTGKNNAITDVAGVRVGHATLIRGDNVRTGVTAILPHSGNLFQEKVPAAIFVGNGFGKLMGSTQVNELGEIETPILLTNTLNVPRVADALIEWMLQLPGNQEVRSINPVVAETNDGYLNDIRGRHVGRDEVFTAIKSAKEGTVEEGSVGAGTGTVAFGWKGGVGTSSRVIPQRLVLGSAVPGSAVPGSAAPGSAAPGSAAPGSAAPGSAAPGSAAPGSAAPGSAGGYTVGVLVQSNYGGVLTINGAPVGRELGKYYLKEQISTASGNGRRSRSGLTARASLTTARSTDQIGDA